MYHTSQALMQKVVRSQSLLQTISPYQRIEIDMTNQGLGLFLDDEMQFVEQYEKIYHHALAGTPFNINPNIQRALILGGGDGLAARTIFEHNPSAKVAVAELDPHMINVCKHYSPISQLNKRALERTHNIIDDAQNTIRKMPNGSIDMVICDFPDVSLGTLSLYSPYLYSEIFRTLRKGGVVSSYPGGNLSGIQDIIKNQFGNVKIMEGKMDRSTKCYIVQGVKTCLP